MSEVLGSPELTNSPEILEASATSRIAELLDIDVLSVQFPVVSVVEADVYTRLERLKLLIDEGVIQPQDIVVDEQSPNVVHSGIQRAVDGIRLKGQLMLEYHRVVLANGFWHPENEDSARSAFRAFSAAKTLREYSVVSLDELGLSDRFDYFARRAWIEEVIVAAQNATSLQFHDESLRGVKHYFRYHSDDSPENYGYSSADFIRLGALDGRILSARGTR
jgi:hypothetical protein